MRTCQQVQHHHPFGTPFLPSGLARHLPLYEFDFDFEFECDYEYEYEYEFDFDFEFDFEWGFEYEYEYSNTSAFAALLGSTGAVRLLTRPRLRRFSA